MPTSNKSTGFINYMKLVKFSHTIFAMPFAIIGYFIAISHNFQFDWVLLAKVVLCMVFARNAAMAFNRYADREIDYKNPRTAIREIPAGIIKPQSALKFVLINSLAFIITTGFINSITFFLSPIALLVVLGYSLTKRFTAFCHFILGLGLSLAPIGAYLAVTGRFDWLPLIFSFIVLFWVSGFDIIYALQDTDFDAGENLKSIPSSTGIRKAIVISTLLHAICAVFVILAGYWGNLNLWYWVGASVFIFLLIYQHLIVKEKNLSRLNHAFFTTNGIASVVYSIFTIADILC